MLGEIIAHKRIEIEKQKLAQPESLLRANVLRGSSAFVKVLQQPGLKVIAEIKPKSPSSGILDLDVSRSFDSLISIYNKYACAISVLTDSKFFGGSMQLLSQVVRNSEHPVLCKDFILDPYQCFLAREAGSEAVLLIAKFLSDSELEQLVDQIMILGMTPIFEVQNENELQRALSFKPEVILINNRNLDNFVIDLETTIKLAPRIPEGIICISASGINSAEDINKLSDYCTNFLVGSVLMRSSNLEATFVNLTHRALASGAQE